MNKNRHGLKTVLRPKRSLAAVLSAIREPKLSRKEKAEVEEAWKIEIRRRLADYRAGKTKCIPADVVMCHAYRALDRMDRLRRAKNKKRFQPPKWLPCLRKVLNGVH